MSVLGRYVMRAVIGYTLLVLLVLLVLSGLYLLITQQDDIGTGNYTVTSALMYVGLNLPQSAFDMLPIASLIGALLSLGNLARSMELVVIRAAGVSVARVALWVFSAGLILMAMTWIIGEHVAPPLEQYGRELKTFQKFQDYSMGNRGAWAKDGDRVFAVQRQNAESSFGSVYVFQFNAQRRLVSIGRANSASIDAQNHWELTDFRQSLFEDDDRVVTRRDATTTMKTNLSAEFLGLASVKPESMPVRALASYARHLKRNDLDARPVETAMWARIARTVAVAIIVVLAVPFAFGPMRSTGTGARTVVGIMIGVVFLLLARLMDSSGAVFGLSPLVVGWLPTVLLALVTSVAVARVR